MVSLSDIIEVMSCPSPAAAARPLITILRRRVPNAGGQCWSLRRKRLDSSRSSILLRSPKLGGFGATDEFSGLQVSIPVSPVPSSPVQTYDDVFCHRQLSNSGTGTSNRRVKTARCPVRWREPIDEPDMVSRVVRIRSIDKICREIRALAQLLIIEWE